MAKKAEKQKKKLIFMAMTDAEESIKETENVSHKSALKKGSHLAVARGLSGASHDRKTDIVFVSGPKLGRLWRVT